MSKDARKRRRRNDRPDLKKPSKTDDQITGGMWAVAFLDLMGYRQELIDTEIFPLPTGPNAQMELAVRFRSPLNRRESLVDGPNNFIKAVSSARDMRDSPQTNRELRKLLEEVSRVKIRTTGFSDSVFMESALAGTPGHLAIADVYVLTLACAATIMLHLAVGSPVRGGVDVSNGLLKDGHLYSAATVRAVELEKCAKFPRILVGEWFRNYLGSFNVDRDPSDRKAAVEAAFADEIASLLYQDPVDHLWAIDYLGEKAKKKLGVPATRQMVANISEFARKSKEAFDAKGDSKVAGYYDRLVKYVDDRLPIWDLKPQPPGL